MRKIIMKDNRESYITIHCKCGEVLINAVLDKQNKNINLGNGFVINCDINDNIILEINAILKCSKCGRETTCK
jgi:hypothetical protein